MNPESIITDFKQHQRALVRAPATIEWQEFVLWRFFAWLDENGIRRLTDVDQKTMMRYQLYVSRLRNRKGVPYDPRVQNSHITAVRRLFKHLRLKNEVFIDPTAGMELARKPKKLPQDILSLDEVMLLLGQPDTKTWFGIRDKAMLEVLYSTGLRRAELLKLDLPDLRASDKTIFVREGKYSRDRVVPCGKTAWRWVKRYLKDVRPLHVRDPDEQAVFISLKGGGRLGTQGLKYVLDYCCRHAGIEKHVTPHTLRHSCATHMSDAGADIAHIQQLLGHARADSTTVYLHVAITRLKQVHAQCHPREQMEGDVTEKTA